MFQVRHLSRMTQGELMRMMMAIYDLCDGDGDEGSLVHLTSLYIPVQHLIKQLLLDSGGKVFDICPGKGEREGGKRAREGGRTLLLQAHSRVYRTACMPSLLQNHSRVALPAS